MVLNYVLPEAAEGNLTLTFRDTAGTVLRTIKSKKQDAASEPATDKENKEDEDSEPKVPTKAGLNRFVWDMRGAPAQKIASGDGHKDVDLSAPRVPPGPLSGWRQPAMRSRWRSFGHWPFT